MKNWKDQFELILGAIFLALIVRTFLITGYKVPSNNMAPTLVSGDLIFATRWNYGLRIPFSRNKIFEISPSRGEVVIFSYPDQPRVPFVKRVLAVAGDKVEIKPGEIYVNDERQVSGGVWTEAPLAPFVVSPQEVFLWGDGEVEGAHSWRWDAVPIRQIEGRAFLIWLSLGGEGDKDSPQFRWHRVGTIVK